MSKRFLAKLLTLTMCAGLTLQPVTAYAVDMGEEETAEIVVENEAEEPSETPIIIPDDESEIPVDVEKIQSTNSQSDDMEWEIEILDIGTEPPSEEAGTDAASPNETALPDFDISVTDYTFPESKEYPFLDDVPTLRVEIHTHSSIRKYYNNTFSKYFNVNWPLGNTEPWNSLYFYFEVSPKNNNAAGTYKDTIKIWASNAWGEQMGDCFITVQATIKPKQLLETVEATSNISEILVYEKETNHPDFTVTTGKEAFSFERTLPNSSYVSRWEKKNGDEWKEYTEDTFSLGTYRYKTFASLDPKYADNMKITGGTNVIVDGQQWKSIIPSWDYEGHWINVYSPEFECNYPALSNVQLDGDVLSWDPVEDEDLWYYNITVGKYESMQSECNINLKELCDSLRLYGGIYPVEIVAYDYDREPLTQTYKLEYDYDGPLPKERTAVSDLVMASTVKGMFKEGYPTTNIISSGDMPWIDCTDYWWEIYGEEGWSEYKDNTFGEGTYRYKTRIRIAPDYIDQYKLDPDLKLTVDGNEWSEGEIKLDYNDEVESKEFTSPEYVLPLPEKSKITSISANCDDISSYVIKGAELALPEFTDIDREEVDIRATWCMVENGEPVQPKEATFTPGKWHIIAAVTMKEDFKETYELESSTALTVNGTEWTNITGASDPYYGIYFLSPEYVIEDDEPVIAGGTWSSKWGSTYYETEEGEKLTGIQMINGEYYLFSKNGTLQCNVFYEENGNKYYFGSDGKMVIGWFDKWGATYYADESGEIQTGFVDVDEDTYYFKADGKLAKSIWITLGEAKYYTKSTGKLAKSETITKWGKKYTFDENGVLIQ